MRWSTYGVRCLSDIGSMKPLLQYQILYRISIIVSGGTLTMMNLLLLTGNIMAVCIETSIGVKVI